MVTLTQLMATSAAILKLEKIASSGILPENEECEVRLLIARVCRAYELDSVAERSEPDQIVA